LPVFPLDIRHPIHTMGGRLTVRNNATSTGLAVCSPYRKGMETEAGRQDCDRFGRWIASEPHLQTSPKGEEAMWKNAAGIAAALMLSMPVANAQYARQEYISFPIEDLTQVEFLSGQKEKGRAVTLAGALRVPKPGEKQPVVVLLHGAGGLGVANAVVETWASVLNAAGFATFAVDSYAGRGVYSFADVGKVSAIARIIDANRALQAIAKHPSIDPTRAVLMGFSHGSSAALYGNTERFQKQYGSPDAQYAAYISVYGICTTAIRGDEETIKPVLMLHGLADDWLPASKCREYAERLQKAGKKVSLIEYPDAHHAFDSPNLKTEVKVPQANSSINCSLAEGDNGTILNAATKEPFTATDPCLKKGTTVAYNEAATKKAHEDVKAFLKETLALK
jgi:dienelactone hydrolase